MCASRSASAVLRLTTGMPGPRRHHFFDVAGGDVEIALLGGERAHVLEVLAQLDLLLAKVDRALEVLGRDGVLHVLDDLADLLLEAAKVLGVAGAAQLDLGARLVDHVDRLVRLVAVGDEAARLVDRGAQRVLGVLHLVEGLVALLQAGEDEVGLLDRRRLDLDRLEATQQRAVLLDVLAVLLQSGRADARDLAARERRLQDVRGVERALGRAGADERVDLVDEDDEIGALAQLLEDPLQALLELAAVLGAGDHQRQVERDDPLLRQRHRDAAGDDALRQPLDDRGLPHSRLAEQDGVVLGAAREDLDDAVELLLPPDQRIEGAFLRERGEIAPVLGEKRQLFLLLRRFFFLVDARYLLANGLHVEAVLVEDTHGEAAFDAKDAEQEMLRPDRRVQHGLRFVRGVGQDLLRFLGQRQLGGRGDALDEDALALDLAADLVRLYVKSAKQFADGVFTFAQDPEQDVLGLDDPATELGGFVAGEEQGPAGFLVVLLEHRSATEV